MAESKLDLPNNLLSSKPSDQSWTPKGNDEEKVMMALLDKSKDQTPSESIPLSPQWLYAKSSESKMEARGPSSLSLGSSADSNQKEVWRADTAEERKDWRRITTETESGQKMICTLCHNLRMIVTEVGIVALSTVFDFDAKNMMIILRYNVAEFVHTGVMRMVMCYVS